MDASKREWVASNPWADVLVSVLRPRRHISLVLRKSFVLILHEWKPSSRGGSVIARPLPLFAFALGSLSCWPFTSHRHLQTHRQGPGNAFQESQRAMQHFRPPFSKKLTYPAPDQKLPFRHTLINCGSEVRSRTLSTVRRPHKHRTRTDSASNWQNTHKLTITFSQHCWGQLHCLESIGDSANSVLQFSERDLVGRVRGLVRSSGNPRFRSDFPRETKNANFPRMHWHYTCPVCYCCFGIHSVGGCVAVERKQ